MKVLAHVIAAICGLIIAAVIVVVVFGNASEQSGIDGSAPSAGIGESPCGTISVRTSKTPATRQKAVSGMRAGEPPIVNGKGVTLNPGAATKFPPAEERWLSNIVAATTLCADEIKVDDRPGHTYRIDVSMSFPTLAAGAGASRITYNTIAAAFAAPVNAQLVIVRTTVGDSTATVTISRTAYHAFTVQRKSLRLPLDMHGIVAFSKRVGFGSRDLRLTGWK